MRNRLTAVSDKMLGLFVPQVTAQATTCSEVRSYCDPHCPLWWWKRVHYITCDNGAAWNEYECCGCGC
jgi:hypothetical protein